MKAQDNHPNIVWETDMQNLRYDIKSPNCGRDKNGVFHCRCGKCKSFEIDQNRNNCGDNRGNGRDD